MLNGINAPYLQSFMRLIETQSKSTLANWCIDYAEVHIFPIYLKHYPDDMRPEMALDAFNRPALYGALAVAYDRLGIDAKWEDLLVAAEEECGKMEADFGLLRWKTSLIL